MCFNVLWSLLEPRSIPALHDQQVRPAFQAAHGYTYSHTHLDKPARPSTEGLEGLSRLSNATPLVS